MPLFGIKRNLKFSFIAMQENKEAQERELA
jgi:hypothetical protein